MTVHGRDGADRNSRTPQQIFGCQKRGFFEKQEMGTMVWSKQGESTSQDSLLIDASQNMS